jgi:hypothetical protein
VVNVGDTILASIAATSDLGGGAYQWDALAYDLNTHGDSSTFANSQPQGPLSLAEAAVFEGYNVSNCNQVPYNYMNVTTVDLVSGTPDWNSSAPTPNGFTRFVQPGNTSLPGEPGNICGWAVGTNNSTVTLWQ